MANDITLFTKNLLEDGTVTVTGTPDTGFPESRLYDRAVSLYWKDTATAAYTFHVDQGAAISDDIDFLAIEKHNFDGEDMQWQWSTDDAAWSDAATDWTQSGNAQIIKTIGSALNKRYWRVTVSSLSNPQCSEIFMSEGLTLDLLYSPGPSGKHVSNIRWQRSMGGLERSTKKGARRRQRAYPMFLSAAELTSLRAAFDNLDELRKPFYIKDHEDDYWMARLMDDPTENWDNISNKHITLNLIEQL